MAITVHVPVGLLDTIDEYVEQRDDTETGACSRSDLFCAAALACMKSLGLDAGDVEADVRLERTENVPKTSANKNGQKIPPEKAEKTVKNRRCNTRPPGRHWN